VLVPFVVKAEPAIMSLGSPEPFEAPLALRFPIRAKSHPAIRLPESDTRTTTHIIPERRQPEQEIQSRGDSELLPAAGRGRVDSWRTHQSYMNDRPCIQLAGIRVVGSSEIRNSSAGNAAVLFRRRSERRDRKESCGLSKTADRPKGSDLQAQTRPQRKPTKRLLYTR
jgi:hypothetical protein